MRPDYLAHLERTLRAFVRLVDKLEQIQSPDAPLWAAELQEARVVLAEARRIAFGDDGT
jgi:hypothetical protein